MGAPNSHFGEGEGKGRKPPLRKAGERGGLRKPERTGHVERTGSSSGRLELGTGGRSGRWSKIQQGTGLGGPYKENLRR